MAPNYAEVNSVLNEFKRIAYVPRTVLDFGSGCGAAFWAAFKQWGDQVESFELVDPDEEISQFSMDVLKGDGDNGGHAFVHRDVNFRRYLAPSMSNKFDLIIVHRVLIEVASRESRLDMITNLWNRTNRFLVIIEGSTEGGFNAVMEARDIILMGGCELHREKTQQLLLDSNLLNDDTKSILEDATLSNYMRYNMIKDLFPPNVTLPTRLDPGYVFAPCPHDQGCPKSIANHKDVCKFTTRWDILRADGQKLPSSTQTGSYSYVILAKGAKPRGYAEGRVLKILPRSKHVCCTVCTQFCGIQRFTVSKRMGSIYRSVRHTKEGQLFPVKLKAVGSESDFDVFEEAVFEYEKQVESEKHKGLVHEECEK